MSKQFKDNELLHIATIGKTVGLKGDLKFHIHCDFPEQFKSGASFLLQNQEKIILESVNHERGLIRIAGVTNPEDAKKFTNAHLFTTHEDTKKSCHLEDGQFFWFDIIGCSVYENDLLLGVVEEVERIAISDYLNIVTSEDLLKKDLAKSFLIPYQKPFIVKTDIDKKIIVVSGGLDILEAS
ncbi:MAG TPA: 16S rRNA processing protein RimM [Sulfurimonas sp. UBA12504]|nr:MAG: 16S rRNA processing protein RimM [Sulfurimonas sp. GWF2_37_8]DAB29610.1 MAG TPA: 16S rRNA processing protein RimM [Sulfurimonas sp. UBA12504]